jgi:hypothetical protein
MDSTGEAAMPIVSIVFGGALIALGAWSYIATDGRSHTALIPAYAGGLLVVLGLVAMVERFLKHAMHAAAMIGLLGFIAAGFRFVKALVEGTADLTKPSTIGTGGMTLLCLAFVGWCINSFIQVRRRRKAAAAAGGHDQPSPKL